MGKLNFSNCEEKCAVMTPLQSTYDPATKSWYISIDFILPTTQWGKDCSPHCFWFFFFNWGSERLSNLPPESPKLKASDWDLTQTCPAPKRTFSPLHDSVIFSLRYREGSRQTGTQKESKGTRGQGGKKRRRWGRARVHYPHGSCTLEYRTHGHLGHSNSLWREEWGTVCVV